MELIAVYDPPEPFESLEVFYGHDPRRRPPLHGGSHEAFDVLYEGDWPAHEENRWLVVYAVPTGELYAHPTTAGPIVDATLPRPPDHSLGPDSRALGPVYVLGRVATWSLVEAVLDNELGAHMHSADNVGWIVRRLHRGACLEGELQRARTSRGDP